MTQLPAWLTSATAHTIYQLLQLASLACVIICLLLAIRYLTWDRYSLSLRTRVTLFRRQTATPAYFERLMRAQRLLSEAEDRQQLLTGYPHLAETLNNDVRRARLHLAHIQRPRQLRTPV